MINKFKKPTVTIGITALNEADNIGYLIKALLRQNKNNYLLTEIIIISDGSVDDTVLRAKSVKSSKVRVIDFKDRKGMNNRLNHIFKLSKTDILVKIDADVVPTHSNVISEIVKPFVKNKSVGYVSGKLIARKGKTIIEKAVVVSRLLWDDIKRVHKNGNSVYSCAGPIYALSKKMYTSISFPPNIWADIGYLYFWCIQNNLIFISNKKSTVYIRVPDNFADYKKQYYRYISEQLPLLSIFGKHIESEYKLPTLLMIKYKIIYFIKYPFSCAVIYFINLYLSCTSKKVNVNASAKWQAIVSSKKGIYLNA